MGFTILHVSLHIKKGLEENTDQLAGIKSRPVSFTFYLEHLFSGQFKRFMFEV